MSKIQSLRELPEVVQKMGLYLQNQFTFQVFSSQLSQIFLEAHGQVLALVGSEYTPEVAAQIKITNLSELQAYLNGLC